MSDVQVETFAWRVAEGDERSGRLEGSYTFVQGRGPGAEPDEGDESTGESRREGQRERTW